VVVLIEAAQTFPTPDIWLELCMILGVFDFTAPGSSQVEIQGVYKRHRKLLRKNPEFKTNKGLKAYDRLLKKRLDEAKNGEMPGETTETQS